MTKPASIATDTDSVTPLSRLHLQLLVSNQVDQHSLHEVVHALTNVCYARAGRLNHQLLRHRATVTDIEATQTCAEAWETIGRMMSEIYRKAALMPL